MLVLKEGPDHSYVRVYINVEVVIYDKSTNEYCEDGGQELTEDQVRVVAGVAR